jgi:HPt (histidine-containing phosphotransfer) domain-containing protein
MNNQSTSSTEPQPPVVAAIRYLLRPLVRLLLSHGISFPAFCDLVKSTYVKVAETEFRLDSKPQTDSRISLLTGIHRREINRLRNEAVTEINLSQHASMSALLFTIWSGHPEYLDEQGLPIPLPRLASKGEKRSFESLVQSVSKDFRARVVLDEWLRQGIITLDSEDRVHLSADAFVQPQDMAEKVYYFGQNIHDHLAATVHNLAGGSPPFLERCVFYDKLSADSAKELADYSRTVGMRSLHAVNKRAAELQQRDQQKPDAVYRANFGVYHYSAAETPDEI